MKINKANTNLDDQVLKYLNDIANNIFQNVKVAVDVFQSSKYYCVTDLVGGPIYACTLNKDDLNIAVECHSWLEEIKDKTFSGDYVVWLDSHIATRSREILIHELRHIEQQYIDKLTFKKAQAVDLIASLISNSSSSIPVSPLEKDAFLYQKQVPYNYDWISDAKALFNKYEKSFDEILSAYENDEPKIISISKEIALSINQYEKNYITQKKWTTHILKKVFS